MESRPQKLNEMFYEVCYFAAHAIVKTRLFVVDEIEMNQMNYRHRLMISGKKKSQIALFIIVAIIFLTALGLLISAWYSSQSKSISSIESQKKIPLDALPVKSYYDDCVISTAKEAFEKLGAHGGYIDPYDPEMSGRKFDLTKIESDPTSSDGVMFSEPVIYWYNMDTPNTCKSCGLTKKNLPTISEIETQVSLYIGKNLDKCLARFAMFKEQGYDIKQGSSRTIDTQITEKTVMVYTKEKLEITKGTAVTTIDQHGVDLKFNFRKTYNLAANLTRAEEEGDLLEGMLMKLIGSYGTIDGEIPPIAESTYSYSTKMWVKPVVKQRLQELMQTYIPYIQIANTKGAKVIWNSSENTAKTGTSALDYSKSSSASLDYESQFLKTLSWEFFSDKGNEYKETSVQFMYFSWPIYFNVNPSSGDLLLPNTNRFSNQLGQSSQFNHYEFFYHVSYPTIVMIRDEEAPFPEGYKFLFAMEANIRCNKDLHSWERGDITICPWPDPASMSLEPGAETSITDDSGQIITTTQRISKTLMCNPEQKIGAMITLNTYDQSTNEALPGVVVSYGCGRYNECPLSTSSLKTFTNETTNTVIKKAVYTDILPICKGMGYLKFTRDGYREKVFEFESLQGKIEDLGSIYLEKERDLNVSLKILDLEQGLITKSTAREPREDEQVILTLSRAKENILESDFARAITISHPKAAEQVMKLSTGSYSISAIIMDKTGFTIPAKCTCNCKEGDNKCGGPTCMPYDKIEVKPATMGGATLDNVRITLTNTTKEVVFYAVRAKTPRCLDDLQNMGNNEKLSAQYRFQMIPDVINEN